ncbi:ABC transporter substrate-binding protein [Lachnospiraceae bacterium 54-53]
MVGSTEANPDEKVQAFDKKYKEIYKQSYDQNAPQAYDSVYLWADAVKRAGTTDGQAVRDALLATKDFEGVAGTYNFSSNGEMVKTLMVVQIQDGKHTIIPMN